MGLLGHWLGAASICVFAVSVPGCTEKNTPARVEAPTASSAPSGDGTKPDAATATATPAAPPVDNKSPHAKFVEWLTPRMPPGGSVVEQEPNGPKVVHKATATDTAMTIAKAYLDLTDVYGQTELAGIITKENPALAAGTSVTIPHLIAEPYKTPDEDRLGTPADKALRAVFVTGAYAGVRWVDTLDKVAARNMNAVILDGKDYMGPITYPTKVKIALEAGATMPNVPIPDLARAIRFAHARGVRIIMRIPCFHDPWTAKKLPRLSIQGTWGKAFPMGWLDPTNDEAVGYVIDLAKEMMDAGADEINLDYIRFPVHGGLKSAVMPPGRNGERIKVIRSVVHRVHEVTKARKIPLSLDIFGVTTSGDRNDIEMLGQDIGVLGPECEALAPMVYPSHYDAGYMGWSEPGNHPEIVGIGTKGAVAQLNAAKVKGTVIRSWLQAFSWKTPEYGPKYLVEEARQAEINGGVGWMMWSPSNEYSAAWRGFPPVNTAMTKK